MRASRGGLLKKCPPSRVCVYDSGFTFLFTNLPDLFNPIPIARPRGGNVAMLVWFAIQLAAGMDQNTERGWPGVRAVRGGVRTPARGALVRPRCAYTAVVFVSYDRRLPRNDRGTMVDAQHREEEDKKQIEFFRYTRPLRLCPLAVFFNTYLHA